MVSIKPGQQVFLRIPGDPDERILTRTRVVGVQGEVVSLEFESATSDVAGGAEVLLYHEGEGDFVQQPARVVRAPQAAGAARLEVVATGDPIRAEKRREARASTARLAVAARLGEGLEVPVRDVSGSGFAVVSPQRLGAGERLRAELRHRDRVYAGEVSARSFVELGSERFRYGLRVEDEEGSTLREGLRSVLEEATADAAGGEDSGGPA